MPRQTSHQGHAAPLAIRETDLKICELCGWINLESNVKCIVCDWHGHFERNPEVIRAAVELAVRRLGRLELHHVTDPLTYRQPETPSPAARFRDWLNGWTARWRR